MSSWGTRELPCRVYQWMKTMLNLELNNAPQSGGGNEDGTSFQTGNGDPQGTELGLPVPPSATIDVDAIEDEVVESSATAFAQAKSRSRRNRGRTEVIDVDLEDRSTWIAQTSGNKRRRVARENSRVAPGRPQNVPVVPPPPPKEPTFSCPICMGPLVQEMSTKCGHIFCKACIEAAIAAQGKCPTCRNKVTAGGLIRVFLPATS